MYLSKDVTGALALCLALSLALSLPGGGSLAVRQPLVLFTVCTNQESSQPRGKELLCCQVAEAVSLILDLTCVASFLLHTNTGAKGLQHKMSYCTDEHFHFVPYSRYVSLQLT